MKEAKQVLPLKNTETLETHEYTARFFDEFEEKRVTIHATDLENAVHVTLNNADKKFSNVEIISYIGEGSVILKAEVKH